MLNSSRAAEDWHKVTAISETLGITNLNTLKRVIGQLRKVS